MAPESAAAIFVAYATFLPFFAYAYHALCFMTCVVLQRARRFPGNEALQGRLGGQLRLTSYCPADEPPARFPQGS